MRPGASLANLEDIVLCGEIELLAPHEQTARRYGPGDAVQQAVGSGGVFAVPRQVWMLEHMTGFLPPMFLLPVQATLFGTLNFRSLLGMTVDAVWRMLGGGLDDDGPENWKNWLGNVRAHPQSIRRVNNHWEIAEIVEEVHEHNLAHPEAPWASAASAPSTPGPVSARPTASCST